MHTDELSPVIEKQDIRSLTPDQLEEFLLIQGEKKFRIKQIHEWVWKKHAASFDEMTNLSKSLRLLLDTHFTIPRVSISVQQKSKDGTFKMGLQLADGAVVEGVLIPTDSRSTACISTQVGCQLACKFCATGKLGLLRNLSVSEIYDQVVVINQLSEKEYGRSLTNIVVMGMGEPLMNYENTIQALDMVSSEHGMGMSPRRITLSTVGLAKQITKLADEGVRFNLALSLHAPTDEQRSEIMPTAKANPLSKLSESIRYFHEKTGNRITFEYVLLGGFNDSVEDAENLSRFTRIVPCKVNLIEYNAVGDGRFKKSMPENTEAFKAHLEGKNMIVNLRRSRGEDIDAACGQLANQHIQKRF